MVDGAYGDAFKEDDDDDELAGIASTPSGALKASSGDATSSSRSGRQQRNFSVDGATAARIKADRRLGASARSQCALALSALACGDVDIRGESAGEGVTAEQGGAALLRHSSPE